MLKGPGQITHSPLYLPYREYSDVGRWSFFQHRRMSNATPPASKDLFSTVPCDSNWQWTVELLAIRLGAPLSTVSRSSSEQLTTPSWLAGGVVFVPIYGVSRTIVAPSLYIWLKSYAANTLDCLTLHELVMKTYNRQFLANPTDRKWNPVELLCSASELHWIPFPVSWICSEQTIISSSSPAHTTFVPILCRWMNVLPTLHCRMSNLSSPADEDI